MHNSRPRTPGEQQARINDLAAGSRTLREWSRELQVKAVTLHERTRRTLRETVAAKDRNREIRQKTRERFSTWNGSGEEDGDVNYG